MNSQFGLSRGLQRHWEREAEERYAADSHNQLLQLFLNTLYRPGDCLLLDGQWRVRVTEVLPKGYITAPRSFNVFGRLGEAVICDQPLYRYESLGDGGPSSGQTTEDHLSRPSTS